jgi:hypothetical protein
MTSNSFKSHKVLDGVLVFKNTKNSNVYQVRIRIPSKRNYIVRSLKTSNLVEAKELAIEQYKLLFNMGNLEKVTKKETLEYWCNQYINFRIKNRGKTLRNSQLDSYRLISETSGLCSVLGQRKISDITNQDLDEFFDEKKVKLSNNTKNKYISSLTAVLRYAFSNNALDRVQEFHRYKVKSNPRASFEFDDTETSITEYEKILERIRVSIKSGDKVRYRQITDDLYNLVLFVVHTQVRPIISELYSIKHEDIKIEHDSLRITIHEGKTGFRYANSTSMLVDIYKKMKKSKSGEYLFANQYQNRNTAKRMFQDQFRYILNQCELYKDKQGRERTLYSLRHLGIQMRLIYSQGDIDLISFVQHLGTSVQMLEKFYAKYLPRTKERIKNLQTFKK